MKGKFKIWCETNKEKDDVLKKMEREGIKWKTNDIPTHYIDDPCYKAPIGLYVDCNVLTRGEFKDYFNNEHKDLKTLTPEQYLGNNECIVIYRKDQKVIALDKSTGKKAEAVCNPDDDFDFKVGAKLAFERLMKQECKFKVGDKVVAHKNTPYVITNNGWTGTVVELLDPEKTLNGDDIYVEDDYGTRFYLKSEYFDLYEGIKVGDTVKVVDSGYCFTTYSDWVVKNVSDAKRVAKYCYGERVEDGMKGTVIAIADHTSKSGKLLVYFETYCGCYLIDIKGLKKC